MDPVTHGLAGAVMKHLGFQRKRAMGVMVSASLAPDIDYLSRLGGTASFLEHHRGITHSVFALFLVPLSIAILAGGRKDRGYYYCLGFLAYAFHIMLDLTNSYGVRILSPIDDRYFSLDLNFIIEPYVTVGLLLAFLIARRSKDKGRKIAVYFFLLFFLYTGAKHMLHERAEEYLKARLDDQAIQRVTPLPGGLFRWWYVSESKDGPVVGVVDMFTDGVYAHRRYPRQGKSELMEASKDTSAVRAYLSFAQNPYAEVINEVRGARVVWRDLSYAYLRNDRLTAWVTFDTKGKVQDSGVKY